MNIREMTADDCQAVALLCGELGYPSTAADVESRWHTICDSPFDKVIVAASPQNQVIGFVHLSKELSLTSGPRALLKSLVVSESCRGQGVGSKLLNAAEVAVSGFRVSKIRVGSQIKRADAHRFYERCGYRLLKSWHLFQKEL